MAKASSILCLAIAAGLTLGYIAWAVAASGAAVFAILFIHRMIARVGLVRSFRLVGSWFWSAAYGIETHRDRMVEARANIVEIEVKRAASVSNLEITCN